MMAYYLFRCETFWPLVSGQHVSSAAQSDARVLGGNPIAEDDGTSTISQQGKFRWWVLIVTILMMDQSSVASYIGRNRPQPVPN